MFFTAATICGLNDVNTNCETSKYRRAQSIILVHIPAPYLYVKLRLPGQRTKRFFDCRNGKTFFNARVLISLRVSREICAVLEARDNHGSWNITSVPSRFPDIKFIMSRERYGRKKRFDGVFVGEFWRARCATM